MQLFDLRVLHRKDNLGIDETPYFSWKLASDRRGVLQSAYRIRLFDGGICVWDTGKRASYYSAIKSVNPLFIRRP